MGRKNRVKRGSKESYIQGEENKYEEANKTKSFQKHRKEKRTRSNWENKQNKRTHNKAIMALCE